jgi:hypothetical protein
MMPQLQPSWWTINKPHLPHEDGEEERADHHRAAIIVGILYPHWHIAFLPLAGMVRGFNIAAGVRSLGALFIPPQTHQFHWLCGADAAMVATATAKGWGQL